MMTFDELCGVTSQMKYKTATIAGKISLIRDATLEYYKDVSGIGEYVDRLFKTEVSTLYLGFPIRLQAYIDVEKNELPGFINRVINFFIDYSNQSIEEHEEIASILFAVEQKHVRMLNHMPHVSVFNEPLPLIMHWNYVLRDEIAKKVK